MSFVYLAGPYSHPLKAVRELRFEMLNEYAAKLMAHGIPVFSPISHSHPIARFLSPGHCFGHEFWMSMDLPILAKAACVLVCPLPGWAESRGVSREVTHARDCGINVLMPNPAQEIPFNLIIGMLCVE